MGIAVLGIGLGMLWACVPRLPRSSAVIGQVMTGRWIWRETHGRTVRLRWEACWNRRVGSGVWLDPFGQNRLAVIVDPERVHLLIPERREWWYWPNTPAGWQRVLGLPLAGDDFWHWLMAHWPTSAYRMTHPGDITIADRLRQYRVAFPDGVLTVTYDSGDDRVFEGKWVFASGWPRVTWRYTYASDAATLPTRIDIVWSDGQVTFEMAWYHVTWQRARCTGVRLPGRNTWRMRDVRAAATQDVPFILSWWRSGA